MRAPLIALLGAALLAGPVLAQPSQFRTPATPTPTPTPAAPAAPATPAAPAAATEESRAAARDLMALLNTDAQSEQMMTAVSHQVATVLAQSSGKPAAEVIAIIDEVLMPEFRQRMPELRDFTVDLWATQMTAPELRELKAFYETPLGHRLQQVTPTVAAASAAFGMKWGQEVALSALAKHRETLRARGLKI